LLSFIAIIPFLFIFRPNNKFKLENVKKENELINLELETENVNIYDDNNNPFDFEISDEEHKID
jgi:hypothetical protein